MATLGFYLSCSDPLLLSHYIQSHLLDPARLPPLLRSTRAALFPNNAPGSPSLVAPSSEAELAALRRRCASAIDALIPTMVGKMYFGSELPGSSSQDGSSRYGPQAAVGNSSSSSVSPGDKVTTDNQIAAAVPPVTASADGTSPISKPPEHLAPATVQAGELVVDQIQCHPGNEDEILSEIERSVLEPFSDIYCNKHLLYGALELILVRLVPELTRKGIIELWEERLS
ncbi:hypothetical protein BX600DRAFT_212355 [Xylariales sp. PMI_506]|nr:hypothetical protein BX600DRAFT_212355 [Xylariales sp. PMI_506]